MSRIDKIFSDYFKNWNIQLPGEAFQSRESGTIHSHGWLIQYQFGSNERGAYLDFDAFNRMTNDRHERIYESEK